MTTLPERAQLLFQHFSGAHKTRPHGAFGNPHQLRDPLRTQLLDRGKRQGCRNSSGSASINRWITVFQSAMMAACSGSTPPERGAGIQFVRPAPSGVCPSPRAMPSAPERPARLPYATTLSPCTPAGTSPARRPRNREHCAESRTPPGRRIASAVPRGMQRRRLTRPPARGQSKSALGLRSASKHPSSIETHSPAKTGSPGGVFIYFWSRVAWYV